MKWLYCLAVPCCAAVAAVALLWPHEAPAAQSDAGKYVGAKKCKMCHIKIFKAWEASEKGKSYERIAGAEDKDLCVPCHTTGHGKAVADGTSPEALHGVQCEACHGPGSEHIASSKDEKKSSIQTSPTSCNDCHTPHVADKAAAIREKE